MNALRLTAALPGPRFAARAGAVLIRLVRSERARELARFTCFLAVAVLVLGITSVYAQNPSEKPLDQIIISARNWIIIKGVVLIGACILAWRCLQSMGGDREGIGKVAMVIVTIALGLASVSVVNQVQTWVN